MSPVSINTPSTFLGFVSLTLRDWSLIMGSGGELQNGRGGGHIKFYSYKRGGGVRKSFSHAEGGGRGGGVVGHNKFRGSVYTVARSFGHIEGGVQKVSTL